MNRMIGKRVLTFLIVAGMMMVQGTDIVRSASVEESNGEMEATEEQENSGIVQPETQSTETDDKKTETENSGTESSEITGGKSEAETEKKEQETETIKATELDLGDYQTEMAVGDKQLLTVTVLPLNATEQNIIYKSDNTKVAEINGMGRITAKAVGQQRLRQPVALLREVLN